MPSQSEMALRRDASLLTVSYLLCEHTNKSGQARYLTVICTGSEILNSRDAKISVRGRQFSAGLRGARCTLYPASDGMCSGRRNCRRSASRGVETPGTDESATGHLPAVSVIVAARDAEATLPAALDSVLAQDYGGELEVIVADGSETSVTRDLVRCRFPRVRIVDNPAREIASGLNRALGAARHPIVARCDAGAVLPARYLARAVDTLLCTGAANVGGRVNPVGTTFFGRAVALATSSPLGAGDARYRIGGAEGSVDTVFPGVFRRDALDAAGGFDETLLALLLGSAVLGVGRRRPEAILVPVAAATIHLAWGAGFLVGARCWCSIWG